MKLKDIKEDMKMKIKFGDAASIYQSPNPCEGELYYATDTQRGYIWSGGTWVCLGVMNRRDNTSSRPTNCVNCGAVLNSCRCEYCGTKYFD